MIHIAITRLPHGEGLPLPSYASEGAAGLDVVAAEDLTLAPGARHAVATGFAIAIPPGYEVQARPRSGLALKHGITCLHTRDDRLHYPAGEVISPIGGSGSSSEARRALANYPRSVPGPSRRGRQPRRNRRYGGLGDRSMILFLRIERSEAQSRYVPRLRSDDGLLWAEDTELGRYARTLCFHSWRGGQVN